MESRTIFYPQDRVAWRAWLTENFANEKSVWLLFPKKDSGEQRISYNDAVEEALCFGWIDSTVKSLDDHHTIQRFSPRRKGSEYSRANIERLAWLDSQNLLHPSVKVNVDAVIHEPYVFPIDILEAIQNDHAVWINFQNFPPAYQRIRVAYIEGARNRPQEFQKRLANLIRKTRKNKMFGYGGIEKHYKVD